MKKCKARHGPEKIAGNNASFLSIVIQHEDEEMLSF
jgi:hypothetical protein